MPPTVFSYILFLLLPSSFCVTLYVLDSVGKVLDKPCMEQEPEPHFKHLLYQLQALIIWAGILPNCLLEALMICPESKGRFFYVTAQYNSVSQVFLY